MKFKDGVRVMSFSIYLDETSLNSIIAAGDFLIENKHPDTQLSIKVKILIIKNFMTLHLY
jgi:hypothetical protein